jgi:DNA-binding PadR family transcriptional regulator
MSVKHGLLVVLADGPAYGARLRAEFERRTGGTWPLNIGQVYTTLARLQRDGLVEQVDEIRKEYAITDAGSVELAAWWEASDPANPDPRDELTIKLALAVEAGDVDVRDVLQRHRRTGLDRLRTLTDEKRGGLPDLASELVLERRIFDTEALVRWLDHVEKRLTTKDES